MLSALVCDTHEETIIAKKKAAKKTAKNTAKKSARKRELINTGTSKRYIRRDDKGKFNEVDEQHRSLSQDRRRKEKKAAKPGQGDCGDPNPRIYSRYVASARYTTDDIFHLFI